MLVFEDSVHQGIIDFELKHFQEQCQGKSAEQMILEAKELFHQMESTEDTSEESDKERNNAVKENLEEVYSLLTKSLYILFESTLPKGFFTEPNPHYDNNEQQGKTLDFDIKDFIGTTGIKSMKSEGKYALKLRFVTNADSSSESEDPIFTRQEYEKLSIEALALRARVLLKLGRPLQSLIDAKDALYFCHRLSFELGEITAHNDYNSIFLATSNPNVNDPVALCCAQRIRINGMLQVLRTIVESYLAMDSYQNALNYAALHFWYCQRSHKLGKKIDEKPMDIATMMITAQEIEKKIERSMTTFLSMNSVQASLLMKHKDIQVFEMFAPMEELEDMANNPTCVRSFVASGTFTEEQVEEMGDFFKKIMESVGAKSCRIEKIPGMGFGIIATKDIRKGEKVCNDDVLVATSLKHRIRCDRCFRHLFNSRNITPDSPPAAHSEVCMHEFYCGVVCNKLAMIHYHKPLCRMWPGVKALHEMSSEGITASRNMHSTALRLWAMKRSAPMYYRLTRLIGRNALPEHIKMHRNSSWLNEKNTASTGQFVDYYDRFMKCLPTLARDPMFNMQFLLKQYALLTQYTFGGQNSMVLNLAGSFFNHSCQPNVGHVDFERGFVAKRDIKEGEQLFVTYIDTGLDVAQRNMGLVQYGFKCECERCVKERD